MSDTGKVSDGYHTFDEHYDHRNLLFLNLMRLNIYSSWVSRSHNDGSVFAGWFIAGIELPTGQITYHLPDKFWEEACRYGVEHDRSPWDGHEADDVILRLRNLLSYRSHQREFL